MKKVLFIGAGRMATAIAGGMVKYGFDAKNIKAFDILDVAALEFTSNTNIKCETANVEELIVDADIIMLAVKPQFLTSAIAKYQELLAKKLIISIVAGVSIEKLMKLTGSSKIIRVMPNTPALVGKGCAGFSLSSDVVASEAEIAEKILNSVGISFQIPEKDLDTVTALSGSGPAYFFEFVDALAESGVNLGLSKERALEMAIATCEGAAKMLKETKLAPEVLRKQVTSPGGTTMKALEVFKERNFREIIEEAVIAAEERSKELGRNI